MTIQHIRAKYKVPAKRGMFVRAFNRSGSIYAEGTILTSHADSLVVDFGDERKYLHPAFNLVYYADDRKTVLCDTRPLDE